jgi:hypothetical protein
MAKTALYLFGIVFCLVGSLLLLAASVQMLQWVFSDHPDIPYAARELSRTGSTYTETIEHTIAGQSTIAMTLGFKNYGGMIDTTYYVSTPPDGEPEGLDIFFFESREALQKSIETNVTLREYYQCRNLDVSETAEKCRMLNGGTIVIDNPAENPRKITLRLTVKKISSVIRTS